MPSPEMLTMAQTAEELGVSRPTLYRWRSLGKGPKTLKYPGGALRVRRSDLESFKASAEQA